MENFMSRGTCACEDQIKQLESPSERSLFLFWASLKSHLFKKIVVEV